jgi:hypothetical protein
MARAARCATSCASSRSARPYRPGVPEARLSTPSASPRATSGTAIQLPAPSARTSSPGGPQPGWAGEPQEAAPSEQATQRVAYLLKESFGQLWSYQNEGWARAFLDRWQQGLKMR